MTNKPPVEEITQAGKIIARAKSESADKYAIEKLGKAESFYEQSMNEWKKQNEIFFVFRDYSLVKDLALKSIELADDAGVAADNLKIRLKQNAEDELSALLQKINRFEKYYKPLPLSRSTLESFNKGKIDYLEAKNEFDKAEYKLAMKQVIIASDEISQAEKAANFKLTSFFDDYPIWKKNIKTAYNLSKKGQMVVLIDKIQSSCTLIKGGKEYKNFMVEFGNNWMGDKIKNGDKATPEGIYKIIEKKYGKKTQYHKALLINYPNNEDRKRFETLIKNGELPKNSSIGGSIEIHGEGGKGVHWTNGCIALENQEMDILYSQCSVNTPVIIVGSRISMEEYLN